MERGTDCVHLLNPEVIRTQMQKLLHLMLPCYVFLAGKQLLCDREVF